MAQVKNAAIVVDSSGSKSIGRGQLLVRHLQGWIEGIEAGDIIVNSAHIYLSGTMLTGMKQLTLEVDSVESINLEEE